MSFIDDDRHAFVIRLWQEPREGDAADHRWRGTIEHIPSGNRSPVAEMADITSFINQRLQLAHGLPLWQHTLREWLSRRHLDATTDALAAPVDGDEARDER